MSLFIQARQWLEGVDANAPGAVLMLVNWLLTYAMRRWAPVQFAALAKWGPEGGKLQHVLGALPGTIASAVLAALWTGADPMLVAKDTVRAALAPLWHHFVKWLPVLPYRGAMSIPIDGPTSRRVIADQLSEIVDAPDVVNVPATASITLNGTERTVPTPCSYEELVDLAGKLGHPSMTLKSGNSGRIISPGDIVALRDGDKINVMHTGDA